jgi:hypothetical protein
VTLELGRFMNSAIAASIAGSPGRWMRMRVLERLGEIQNEVIAQHT